MACLCETCVHDNGVFFCEYFWRTTVTIVGDKFSVVDCDKYEEVHMNNFSVGDRITLVDTSGMGVWYNIGDTGVITEVLPRNQYNLKMDDGHTQLADDYNIAKVGFKVGDKVTIVNNETTIYPIGSTGVIKDIYKDYSSELAYSVRLDDGVPQIMRERHLKLTPSCIVDGNTCSITGELTCCFECPRYDQCVTEGVDVCDFDDCEKFPIDEPCECQMCLLEKEISDIKDELLADKELIIELQRQLLEAKS